MWPVAHVLHTQFWNQCWPGESVASSAMDLHASLPSMKAESLMVSLGLTPTYLEACRCLLHSCGGEQSPAGAWGDLVARRVEGRCLQEAAACLVGAASQLGRYGLDRETEKGASAQRLSGSTALGPELLLQHTEAQSNPGVGHIVAEKVSHHFPKKEESYLGWGALHFFPPGGGLWDPQGKEGVVH